MRKNDSSTWCPFRPDAEDIKAIAQDVAEIPDIQKTILDNHKDIHFPDRVAHQYQIAGGKVVMTVADELPTALQGVGLFEPRAEHFGLGRISTGLGTPHLETNPDFLGLMLAFLTQDGRRVDFLSLNNPTAPTDNHRDFVDLLHATGEAAGSEIPLVGAWGEYDLGNLTAEQIKLAGALKDRLGWIKAGKIALHVVRQTIPTALSSTAYQTYWTGIVEIGETAGKFSLVPTRDENRNPGFRPGEHHLSEEWKARQANSDIEFLLYWIPFLNETKTSTTELTKAWKENHKQPVGRVTFPTTTTDSEEAKLWSILINEMGANPGNWVHDKQDSIREPASEFGAARKIAYQKSQAGRNALAPEAYQSVFETRQIDQDLAQELTSRRDKKDKAGHVSLATMD
jgi:hypothetical protein